MRALTLTQPWAGLVASGIKLVENRPRRIVKREDFGKPFAIHASREIDEDVYTRIYQIAPELRPERKATRCVDSRWHQLSRTTSSVIAVATIDHDEDFENTPPSFWKMPDDQRRWFFGPIGYVLRDVRALATPVPCKGALGFWRLPADVAAKVEVQL